MTRPLRQTGQSLSAADEKGASDAAQCVVRTHERLSEFLREGQTLSEVDVFVAETLASLNCRSCFLNYRVPRMPPFRSHACLSVNDCVVHGEGRSFPQPLKEGDVLKIDIGVMHRGWIGDAAWTYAIRSVSDENLRLMRAGKESLRLGIEQLRPGNNYIAWAETVQRHVENECGFHLIRGLGGHGYGRKLHTPPFISNVVPTFPGEWPDAFRPCEPGTLVAVEPMLAVGTGEIRSRHREWPVFTADGSMSVHYEHDVLITEDGPRVLTEGLDALPEVVG